MKKSGSVGGALLAGTFVLANASSAKAATATLSTSSPSIGVILENVIVKLTAPGNSPTTGSYWTTTYCHAKLQGSTTQFDRLFNGFFIGGGPGTYIQSYLLTDSAPTGNYDCWATASGSPGHLVELLLGAQTQTI